MLPDVVYYAPEVQLRALAELREIKKSGRAICPRTEVTETCSALRLFMNDYHHMRDETRSIGGDEIGFTGSVQVWPQPVAYEPASVACLPPDKMGGLLKNRYEETLVEAGLENSGQLLQLYISEERDTWTIVMASPAGTSCVVASGSGWVRYFDPALPAH